eukprot:9579945-Karenia_brevis.AAC.1
MQMRPLSYWLMPMLGQGFRMGGGFLGILDIKHPQHHTFWIVLSMTQMYGSLAHLLIYVLEALYKEHIIGHNHMI